jgi:hypothetical protein
VNHRHDVYARAKRVGQLKTGMRPKCNILRLG